MKQFCLIVAFAAFFDGNAQVCPPGSPAPEEERNYDADTAAIVVEPEYFDINNISTPSQRRVFRFGYGINTVLSMNQTRFGSSKSRGLSWFNDRPVHVFDLSGELGSRRNWILGFSFSFQRLGKFNESRTYLPEDYLTGSDLQGTSEFTAGFELKANTYSPMFYTEYSIVNFRKNFSAIVHAEAGLSIYRADMSVSYRDTCGCDKKPVSDWEMSSSFNAGLGLGLKWEYRFIGLKALLTYQSQTKVKFRSQEDYQNYTFDFDAAHYDFKGSPPDSRFSVLKSGDGSARRYNPLYLQVVLYFRIGPY